MSLLKNLKTDDTIAGERDSVGGNGPIDSGLYPSNILQAFLKKSDGGALALVLHAKTEAGPEIRQTIWMTSKTGSNTYVDKDGANQYLPGFLLANGLALLTVGKELSELDTEEKVINLYSYDAKAEVPTKVDMVMDLLNKDVLIGLIKQTVDKTKLNEATKKYEPTGETREENEIDKFFRARDRMTVAEIRAQAAEAAFAATWEAKWSSKVRNKATGGAATAGTPGAPKAAAAGTAKPAKSLFAN